MEPEMKKLLSLFAVMTAVLISPAANAGPITTLYNTGVDASGAVLPDGTVGDPHYTLISVPGGTTATRIITSASGFPIPPYIGDNTFSRWIGPNNTADIDGPAGTYVFRTTFDLTGFDFTTANIAGQWSTDNDGRDILINGSSLGYTTSFTQFQTGFSAFAVNSGFVAGINTLDFVTSVRLNGLHRGNSQALARFIGRFGLVPT
jgi:hypothetical protein